MRSLNVRSMTRRTGSASAATLYLLVIPQLAPIEQLVLRLLRAWWNIAAPWGVQIFECTFNAPFEQRTPTDCRRAWRAPATAGRCGARAPLHAVRVRGIHRPPAPCR